MGLVILLAISGHIVAWTVVRACLDWRQDALRRRELQARGLTFRIRLSRVKVYGGYGWSRQRAVIYLSVRGDAFEVSSSRGSGLAYYFRARETTIRLSRDPARPTTQDWIVVEGRKDGKQIKVALLPEQPYWQLATWNALVAAGAVPVGRWPRLPLA